MRKICWAAAVAIVLAPGCKPKSPGKAKLMTALPAVTTDKVLADATTPVPPVVVVLAADGKLALSDAPRTWAEFAKGDPAKATPVDDKLLHVVVSEVRMSGMPVAKVMSGGGGPALDPTIDMAPSQEDPPPPPPEEEDDDGSDESGGTGTAIMLDEGKMGKKDSDRAEGQYKMKRPGDPPLARSDRKQLLAQLRMASLAASIGSNPSGFGVIGDDVPPPGTDAPPQRNADVYGEVRDEGGMEQVTAAIVAAPTAKAGDLIHALGELEEGELVVGYQGAVRVLRLQFARSHDAGDYNPDLSDAWMEVRVADDSIEVEAVASPVTKVPWPKGGGDPAALAKAYADVKAAHEQVGRIDVDVLLNPGADVQRAIDVAAALDLAGARVIGLGRMPAPDELAKRGKHFSQLRLGQPAAVGDLDKAIIRRYVKEHQPDVFACYQKALAGSPGLQGTVQAQFFIDPTGRVASAAASGVSPEVAGCVADVIKGIEFPKPKGGGGVQVNYPFTFR